MRLKNPLSKFMITLFAVSIITIILWVIIIQIYQTTKITNQIDKIINTKITMLSHKIDTSTIEKIKKDVLNNPLIISLEIYKGSQKIIDIKKPQYDYLIKKISIKNFNNTSIITKYKLIPIHRRHMYIYFQTSTKIKNSIYYINMLLKFDNETIIAINKDIKNSIIIIISTILMVYIAIFPIVYSQYKKLSQEQEKIVQGNINTLIALGDAIAQKDNETSEHNYRVTYYSIKLAEQLNLPFEQIQSIIKGAFLHDIGKIGIPDKILLKPAKLTDEEFEIMKTHVLKGNEIITNNPLIEDSKDIVLYHHEKYDGSGYMHGLKGEEIPINARLFAVVDVFDALTSKRPYKEPLDVDTSMNIIKKDTPNHFDPKIVAEFEKIYKDIYNEIYHLKLDELKQLFYKIVTPYFDIKKLA